MTLALIAGQGGLPVHIMASMDNTRSDVLVCALEGFPPDTQVTSSPLWFCVEELGTFLTILKSKGVKDVCFAGSIGRPKLDPSRIDAATMPFVPRMMQALQSGDDAALRVVLSIFEESGFTLKGAHEIAPDLLPPQGQLTSSLPNDQDKIDVLRAAQAHIGLSLADIGQACVASHGQITAVEAMAGTDWMLRSLIKGDPDHKPSDPIPADPISWAFDAASDFLVGERTVTEGGFDFPDGGVLFKAPKKDQDRRIDLPTIGPRTVMLAAEIGLNGIVIEADGVMVLDLPQVVQLAQAQNMFVWVREADA